MAYLQPNKKYHTIGEVAKHFGVSVEVIRKWEKEFPKVIRPLRTQGDTRLYDAKAVSQVGVVYRLLRERGMTVTGAQNWLAGNHNREQRTQEAIAQLQNLRGQLMDMIKELDKVLDNKAPQTPQS